MNSPSGATPACCSSWRASVWAASAGGPGEVLSRRPRPGGGAPRAPGRSRSQL